MKRICDMTERELADLNIEKLNSSEKLEYISRVNKLIPSDKEFKLSKQLDTMIYDEHGNIIGDNCEIEDEYLEDDNDADSR